MRVLHLICYASNCGHRPNVTPLPRDIPLLHVIAEQRQQRSQPPIARADTLCLTTAGVILLSDGFWCIPA